MSKMEYVFLSKQNNISNQDERIKGFIKSIHECKDEENFHVKVKRTIVNVSYLITKRQISSNDENAYHIVFTVDIKDKNKSIEALEIVQDKIKSDLEIRKNYHIVPLYDDISSYYCIKAYPIFHEYEKQIRRLIYKFLTMSLGVLWADKTISKEVKSQLKEQSNGKLVGGKLIEEALHEMSMSQLETYLFSPLREVPTDEAVDDLLSDERIEAMSKEEIVCVIKRTREQSIWNKYFVSFIDIDNLQLKMDAIRKNRNKVAHCKAFSSHDYNESVKILIKDGLIDKISSAIDRFETKELNNLSLDSLIRGLVTFGKYLTELSVIVSPFIIDVANTIASKLNAIKEEQKIFKQISNDPAYEAIKGEQKAFREIINDPAYEAIKEEQKAFRKVINDPVYEAIKEERKVITQMISEPAYKAAIEEHKAFNKILSESVLSENNNDESKSKGDESDENQKI